MRRAPIKRLSRGSLPLLVSVWNRRGKLGIKGRAATGGLLQNELRNSQQYPLLTSIRGRPEEVKTIIRKRKPVVVRTSKWEDDGRTHV